MGEGGGASEQSSTCYYMTEPGKSGWRCWQERGTPICLFIAVRMKLDWQFWGGLRDHFLTKRWHQKNPARPRVVLLWRSQIISLATLSRPWNSRGPHQEGGQWGGHFNGRERGSPELGPPERRSWRTSVVTPLLLPLALWRPGWLTRTPHGSLVGSQVPLVPVLLTWLETT